MASRAAGCGYCMAHTAHTADRVDLAAEKENALWEFETSPLFSAAEHAALRVAQGAAQVLNAVTDADFSELRKHYSDAQIVDIVAVIALFRLSEPVQRHDGNTARKLADRSRQALPRRARLDHRQVRCVSSGVGQSRRGEGVEHWTSGRFACIAAPHRIRQDTLHRLEVCDLSTDFGEVSRRQVTHFGARFAATFGRKC